MISHHYVTPHLDRHGRIRLSVIVYDAATTAFIKDACYSLSPVTIGLNGHDEPQGFMYRATIGLDGVE